MQIRSTSGTTPSNEAFNSALTLASFRSFVPLFHVLCVSVLKIWLIVWETLTPLGIIATDIILEFVIYKHQWIKTI